MEIYENYDLLDNDVEANISKILYVQRDEPASLFLGFDSQNLLLIPLVSLFKSLVLLAVFVIP